jgi:hypothetical protein
LARENLKEPMQAKRKLNAPLIIVTALFVLLGGIITSTAFIFPSFLPYRDVVLVVGGALLGFSALALDEYLVRSVERAAAETKESVHETREKELLEHIDRIQKQTDFRYDSQLERRQKYSMLLGYWLAIMQREMTPDHLRVMGKRTLPLDEGWKTARQGLFIAATRLGIPQSTIEELLNTYEASQRLIDSDQSVENATLDAKESELSNHFDEYFFAIKLQMTEDETDNEVFTQSVALSYCTRGMMIHALQLNHSNIEREDCEVARQGISKWMKDYERIKTGLSKEVASKFLDLSNKLAEVLALYVDLENSGSGPKPEMAQRLNEAKKSIDGVIASAGQLTSIISGK